MVIVNEINPDYPLQKSNFDRCKGSCTNIFEKNTHRLLLDCNEQVSQTFMDLINTILIKE
jgi:hypothetical protein